MLLGEFNIVLAVFSIFFIIFLSEPGYLVIKLSISRRSILAEVRSLFLC